MKTLATLAVAATALTLAASVSAQSFAKPEDAIRYRQGAFRVLSAHFGALGAMANNRVPFDAQAAARHADVIAALAPLPFHAFAAGTERGENTRARGEIWSEQAKFRSAADRMNGEVTKLAAAAKTGNLDNLKNSFGPAAATCKACHDDFRRD